MLEGCKMHLLASFQVVINFYTRDASEVPAEIERVLWTQTASDVPVSNSTITAG